MDIYLRRLEEELKAERIEKHERQNMKDELT